MSHVRKHAASEPKIFFILHVMDDEIVHKEM